MEYRIGQKNSSSHKSYREMKTQPDETWNQLDCVVKRQNIKSYKDGEKEIDVMTNNSETEPDAKKRRKFVDVPQVSYNIMAEESLKVCEL